MIRNVEEFRLREQAKAYTNIEAVETLISLAKEAQRHRVYGYERQAEGQRLVADRSFQREMEAMADAEIVKQEILSRMRED